VDEAHPLHPVDVNGVNKLAGEMYHLLYYQVYGIQTSVLRLTNTYGPRMRVVDARQTFLGIWIRRLLEGQPIVIFGTGGQLRDFNYVDDVVDALLLVALAKEANGEIFNLGHDRPVSLRETAELLIELNGKGTYQVVPFPVERQAIDIGDYYGDFGKIRRCLGWTPSTSLQKGLRHTLEFYERHAAQYWPSAVAV
jgi:UDP-glucose 4-epimerase